MILLLLIGLRMILSFGDKEAEKIFNRFPSRKLPGEIQEIAYRKLLVIHFAHKKEDLVVPPGNKFEKLKGKLKNSYSIRINDQWRIVFKFEDGNANDVTIEDYHRRKK
jgi:proteic killer suppression protein